MEQIRWGILGCANIVERAFLPALFLEAQNGVLQAIATRGDSPRLQRIIKRYNPPEVYMRYEDLLEDPNIDAVYIPLPNALHKEWAVRAAEHGKHVLCEKTLAPTVGDIDEIRLAAAANGVVIMEAFACMHSPLYPAIRRLIDEGEIGELRMVDAQFCGVMQNKQTNINARPELCGGSIFDVGCYNILSIRQITKKEPVTLQALAVFMDTGVDAMVQAAIDMGDGVLAGYKSSLISVRNRALRVYGTQGYISFPHTPNTWGELPITLNNQKGQQQITLHCRNTYALEIEHMGRCILQGEAPLMPLEESRKNVRVLTMLHEAIGSWMRKR